MIFPEQDMDEYLKNLQEGRQGNGKAMNDLHLFHIHCHRWDNVK